MNIEEHMLKKEVIEDTIKAGKTISIKIVKSCMTHTHKSNIDIPDIHSGISKDICRSNIDVQKKTDSAAFDT